MIIVTGATGFIGNYLVETLVQKRFDVLAVGRSKTGKAYYDNKGIPFLTLEITEKEDFRKLPKENVEAVVHLAAVVPEHRHANDRWRFT